MENRFQTIVLGLGAMGSAITYQLAKRGNRVLGIDQFSLPHPYGSSHGDVRLTRQAIGEGERYIPLVLRAHELWREIEKETGECLLTTNGGLIISNGVTTAINFENTVAVAEKYNIAYEVLNARQIRKRFPQFNVQENEFGYFEKEAGFLRPEQCVKAQLKLAKKYNAEINENEKVSSFDTVGGRVQIVTDKGTYECQTMIIAAGPWLPELLEEQYKDYFKVMRQVLFSFDVEGDIDPFLPKNCPIFIWELQDNKRKAIYGFPIAQGAQGGVSIASEQYEMATTPDTVDRHVSEEEIQAMYQDFVAPYIPALSNRCIEATACLYTVTRDSGFVIDKHPGLENVIIVSPCSGRGFKHSAAIGEAVSELIVDGASTVDLDPFKFSRFF